MALPISHKVLIYGMGPRGLLVFAEPDFPEIALQVPGGTIEAGEAPKAAATREWVEETGLPAGPMQALGVWDSRGDFGHGPRHYRRHYFHLTLSGDLPATWDHHEKSPSSGGPPILFRFFWLPVGTARARLGYGQAEALDRLN